MANVRTAFSLSLLLLRIENLFAAAHTCVSRKGYHGHGSPASDINWKDSGGEASPHDNSKTRRTKGSTVIPARWDQRRDA